MNAAATIVPALAQPESPLPATVLPSQSGTADTDAPAVPAIARPADSSSSSETEAQTSVAQPPTTASAAADTLNAGATDAAHPGGTPSPEASPPESAVPLPVVSPAATPSEAAGAAGTEARASGTTVEPSASAAQSEPPSDTSPRADTVEVTGGAGTDARRGAATVEPSAAAAQSAPAPSDTPSPAAEFGGSRRRSYRCAHGRNHRRGFGSRCSKRAGAVGFTASRRTVGADEIRCCQLRYRANRRACPAFSIGAHSNGGGVACTADTHARGAGISCRGCRSAQRHLRPSFCPRPRDPPHKHRRWWLRNQQLPRHRRRPP